MAASARIDELRSKFDDNPRRYFAPLANEYRKAGDLGTAIAICRTQLRQFPTHMSGHVVLGQALFEAGELREAQEVLARAVELDPENLIALRHLGDIARQNGESGAAREWYRRVLDADPYNEQIAETLATLEVAAQAPTAPQAPDHSDLDDSVRPIDANPDRVAAAEPAEAQFVDLSMEELRWAPPALAVPEPESGPVREPASQAAGGPTVEAAESFEFIDDWVAAPPAPTIPDAVPPTPPESPAAAEEPDPAFDPVVGLDLPPVHDAALEQVAAAEPIAPAPDEAWPAEPAGGMTLVTSDEFATETMAELCLEQGHDEQALAIFEWLLAQRPGDVALAARIDALRLRLRPRDDEPSAGDYLRELADIHPAVAAASSDPQAPPDAPSVERAAAEPAVTERDEWAARAWADAFRPDARGETGLRELIDRAQEAPATREFESAPMPARVDEPAEPDLSFDRFFVGLEPPALAQPDIALETPAAERAAPVADWREEWPAEEPTPAAPPAETESSVRRDAPAAANAAPADDDDLAEFNAWLRGLRDS